MTESRKYDLEQRLIRFATEIINIVKSISKDRVGSHLGQQLLRSGTAPALNYGEALSAESRRDFIHKLRIALKELRESIVILQLLINTSYLKQDSQIVRECNELIAIFVKSIQTAQQRDLNEKIVGSHR